MFKLSNKSLGKLEGVNSGLVNVVKRAIELTEIDFGVSEGLRTYERQKMLLEKGTTKTLKSKHLTGRAVDLFAYVNNKISWKHEHYYVIADAMKKSALELGVKIRWGGAWHIDDLGKSEMTAKECHSSYVALRKSQGRKPFNDMPHFELM